MGGRGQKIRREARLTDDGRERTFDLIVRNATIIDGTRAPRYRGEIGVRGDKIVKIGALDRASADTEIDGSGLIAAPGFIDAHTHDDRMLLSNPDMAPKASQGVTTVVAGNCGISLAHSPANGSATPPLDLLDGSGDWFKFPTFRAYREELAAHPAAINATCLVGHTTFRVAAMDRLDRAATPAEIAKMRAMAHESLGVRRDRSLHRHRVPAGGVRADGGNHRDLPAAVRIRRTLRHAHAQRGRPHHRVDRGNLPDRPHPQSAGRDFAP